MPDVAIPKDNEKTSYFLTGEKVCKEPPGPPVWSRTPRRLKGKVAQKRCKQQKLPALSPLESPA